MSFSRRVMGVFDRIVDVFGFLSGVLIVLLMLLVCYDVVMRYWFRAPTGWLVELCEYMLLYITFLGTTWILRADTHIRMDIVISHLSRRTQRILEIITSAMGAISCSFLTVYAAKSTWYHFGKATLVIQTLSFPKWTLLVIIPVGSFLLAVQFVRRFLNFIRVTSEAS